jgi:hypothetical protein
LFPEENVKGHFHENKKYIKYIYISQALWERFNLDEAARAEVPLGVNYAETYPIGMTIDRTAQTEIPLGTSILFCTK